MTNRILLVEDEPDIRKTLKYNFSRESCDVITAGSISEAENLSSNHQVDLIILDLMLPDGSGLDFCRAIKSDKERKHGPLVKTKDSTLINTTKLSKKACFNKIKSMMDKKLKY